MNVLEFIKQTIGKSLAQVLMKMFDALQKISELLLAWHNAKLDKQKKQEQKQKEDKIDDIADNGTIEDLLDIHRLENLK